MFRNEYKGQIVKQDIFERFGIRNRELFDWLIDYLCKNAGSPTSYRRLVEIIAQSGVSTTTASVIEYINFIKSSYFVDSTELFTRSSAKKLVNPKRFYPLDHSFVKQGKGSLLETLVFNNLKAQGQKISYWQDAADVDFVISKDELEYIPIQVALDMPTQETEDRELKALVNFFAVHYYIKNKIAYVITDNPKLSRVEHIADAKVYIMTWQEYFSKARE
jgi:uncharacterized protein